MTDDIYVLIGEGDWQIAKSNGDYSPESLISEGFIHACTEEQLLHSANKFYAGRHDVLALKLDAGSLNSHVKYEPAKNGKLYPHIYCPLKITSVAEVIQLVLHEDGLFMELPSPLTHSNITGTL